jgi:hypothetical protein
MGEIMRSYKSERIVNKQDADRIFGLNLAEWNRQAKQMIHPEGWEVRSNPLETGTAVMAFDQKTGWGHLVQPLFPDAEGPPEMLIIGSYYPARNVPRVQRYAETRYGGCCPI